MSNGENTFRLVTSARHGGRTHVAVEGDERMFESYGERTVCGLPIPDGYVSRGGQVQVTCRSCRKRMWPEQFGPEVADQEG